ncbi:MAG: hypothetical protein AAF772_19780, partial [Acidobacteriota bacterium]
FLERGRGAPSTAPHYVEALLHLQDGEHDDALRLAQQARRLIPWEHEVDELIGAIHSDRADAAYPRGLLAAFWPSAGAADDAYRTAIAAAPSDPRIARAHCRLRAAMLLYATATANAADAPESSPPSVVAYRDTARVACLRAHRIAPDHAEAFTELAWIAQRWADHQLWTLGEDNRRALRRGRTLAHQALRRDPRSGAAADVLSDLHRLQAESLQTRASTDDVRPWLDLAERYHRHATRFFFDDDVTVHRMAAILYGRGYAEVAAGVDATQTFQRAVVYAERSVAAASDKPARHYNLGVMRSAVAQMGLMRGRDIRPALGRSTDAYRRALRLNPDDELVALQIALNYGMGAQAAFYRGDDPRPWVAHAVARMNDLLARKPVLAHLHDVRAGLLVEGARHVLNREEDPRPLLRRADISLRMLASLPPGSVSGLYDPAFPIFVQIERWSFEAHWRWNQGQPIEAQLAAIDALATPAHRTHPTFATICAGVEALRTKRALTRGATAAATRAAETMADCIAVMAQHPRHVPMTELALYRGILALLHAAMAPPETPERQTQLDAATAQWAIVERENPWMHVYLTSLRAQARMLARGDRGVEALAPVALRAGVSG